MSDLIKREDAIKAVWGDDINPSEVGMVFEAQSHIDRDIRLIPSADRPQGEWIVKVIRTDGQKYFDIEYVRDVVMCKDCRWGKPYSDKQLECVALGLGGLKSPDDFCSYGERKESE